MAPEVKAVGVVT